MTLRARLTAAFLVVVLGPVVLGAIFVGITVSAVGTNRTQDRLDVAADTAALLGSAGARLDAARHVVERDLATAVQLQGPTGAVLATAGPVPPQPWADCSATAPM